MKELQPHIVGAAIIGMTGKLADILAAKSGGPKSASRDEQHADEKRKAFIARIRRRLTDCNSELPLRRQQLTRLKAQQRQSEVAPPTLEAKAIPNEIALAEEFLTKADEVLKRLEMQVQIEEKRQVCSSVHWS